jgi:outer membrane lipoprotein-sorting protein
MVPIHPRRFVRYVFILFFAISVVRAQELSEKEVNELLSRLAESRGNSAMQASFREERRLALMEKPVIESGTVSFLPPDKFRRQVNGGSLTVCDGETLWLFYPQFGEAEKYALSSNRPLRESVSAMTSGIGLQNLEKNYNVQGWRNADGYRVKLTPKSSSLRKAVAEVQIEISDRLFAKRLNVVSAEGDHTVITFSDERNVNLSPEDFRFQPPEDVRVSEPTK